MPNPRFETDPPEMRLIHPIEGMTLLFHRPSGSTHIIASPAPEILDMLGDGPADAAEVLERLIARHGVDAGADAGIIVAARLAELEAAGLVWRS